MSTVGTAWPGHGDTVTSDQADLDTSSSSSADHRASHHDTLTNILKTAQKSTLDSWVDIKESPDILVDIKNVAASYFHIQGAVVFDVDWEYGF